MTAQKYPWIHGQTTSGNLGNTQDVVNSLMDAYGNPAKPGRVHLDFVEGSFEGSGGTVTVTDAQNGSAVNVPGSWYNNVTGQSQPAKAHWTEANKQISAVVKDTNGVVLADVPAGPILIGQMVLEKK